MESPADLLWNTHPDYPGVKISRLKVGDRITIRAFFPIGTGEPVQVDGGLIDLEVEHVDTDHILAVILTQLPDEFALGTGGTIELWEDDILYKNESREN